MPDDKFMHDMQKRAAQRAKADKPATPKDNTVAQLEQAKGLIQQQKYNEARALLITVDHPTADKWLARLPSGAVTSPSSAPAPASDKSFTVKLVLTLFLLLWLFLPGLIALNIFADEAKRYPDAPGAGGLLMLRKYIFWVFLGVLALVVVLMVMTVMVVITSTGPGGVGIYTLF